LVPPGSAITSTHFADLCPGTIGNCTRCSGVGKRYASSAQGAPNRSVPDVEYSSTRVKSLFSAVFPVTVSLKPPPPTAVTSRVSW
jgi:hypothetical protein